MLGSGLESPTNGVSHAYDGFRDCKHRTRCRVLIDSALFAQRSRGKYDPNPAGWKNDLRYCRETCALLPFSSAATLRPLLLPFRRLRGARLPPQCGQRTAVIAQRRPTHGAPRVTTAALSRAFAIERSRESPGVIRHDRQ